MASKIVEEAKRKAAEAKSASAAKKKALQEQLQSKQDEMKEVDTQKNPYGQMAISNEIKSLQEQMAAAGKTTAAQRGRETAIEVLGPEGLERLGADVDIQDVLARKKRVADVGIEEAEQEAIRERMARQMMQSEQQAGLTLGGRLGGAQGAAVAAQQRSLMAAGMQARAGIERDIFLASQQAKRAGLESYASSLGEVKTFDIGQAAKERDILQSSIMGYEQMASAERAAQLQAEASAKRSRKGRK